MERRISACGLRAHIDIATDDIVARVAFAGDRGVAFVQMRIGDEAWREAELRSALSPITWMLWSLKAGAKGKGMTATHAAVPGGIAGAALVKGT